MHSKSLLSILAIVALTLSVGCGGGGGGGSSTPQTTYTVSGSISPTGVNNSWVPSVRGDATLANLGLTAQLVGKGNVKLSENVSVGSDGKFTLSTTTPDTDAIVKIFNSKGFDFRFHLGVFTQSRADQITVDASSTARTFLNWQKDWKVNLEDNDAQLANVVASIVAALAAAPEGVFETKIQTAAEAVRTNLTRYDGYYNNIRDNNTALETIFMNANQNPGLIGDAMKAYFSAGLNSTQAISGYGLDHFITATKSRYERYTVNAYSFTIQEIRFTSETTASVTVSFTINVTPKAGDGLSGAFGPVAKVIGWSNESGTWKVWQDFPYLREQFGF